MSTVIVPDDLWKDIRKHFRRSTVRLARFMETHPEQHKCIAPTGKHMMELGKLIDALTKANKDEEKRDPNPS